MARLIQYEHRGKLLSVDKATINGIEAAIRWADVEVPKQARIHVGDLARRMALINQMYARKMSFGPSDPYQRQPEQAWRMPGSGIRRISGNYYISWKVKNSGPGWWTLYNDSREAYFIEFGIHVSNRRVRRPVRKLSQIKTLKYMMSTQAYHRVWSDIYLDPRRGKRRKIGGFTQTIQSPAGGHGVWQNISEHQANSVIKRNARKGRRSPTLRRGPGGKLQQRVWNKGGGSYEGPMLGRRIP